MNDFDQETMNKLLEAKIPADDYARIMEIADNESIDIDENDPVSAFKQAVIELNEQASVPSWAAEYCTRFDVGHEMPEIEVPEMGDSSF